jgi:hypothetical protein
MKKILLCLSCIFIYLSSWGQLGEMTAADLNYIKKSKTYIVLDEDDHSRYNQNIRLAVKKFWKLTPLGFIKASQLNDYIKRDTLTFIVKSQIKDEASPSGNPSAARKERAQGLQHDAIALIKGGKHHSNLRQKDWLAYVMLDDITNIENYYFKLGEYIQVIQDFTRMYEATNELHRLSFKQVKEKVDKNKINIQSKVLLLRDHDLPSAWNSKEEIRKYYPYAFEFSSKEDIENSIHTQDRNSVIFNTAYTANKFYYYIFDCQTGKVLYFFNDDNYMSDVTGTIKKALSEIAK